MSPEEVRFALLRLIETQPDIDQRGMAKALGVSLGRAHYCLRALIEKGYVKSGNFRRNPKKSDYLYVITPAGMEARLRQTAQFLQVKRAEYDRLRQEIENLTAELAQLDVEPEGSQ